MADRAYPYHIIPVKTCHDPCPFCHPEKSRILSSNPLALALPDAFPLSPGHTLIIPKRHIASYFEATREEQTALLDLLAEVRWIFPDKARYWEQP